MFFFERSVLDIASLRGQKASTTQSGRRRRGHRGTATTGVPSERRKFWTRGTTATLLPRRPQVDTPHAECRVVGFNSLR